MGLVLGSASALDSDAKDGWMDKARRTAIGSARIAARMSAHGLARAAIGGGAGDAQDLVGVDAIALDLAGALRVAP